MENKIFYVRQGYLSHNGNSFMWISPVSRVDILWKSSKSGNFWDVTMLFLISGDDKAVAVEKFGGFSCGRFFHPRITFPKPPVENIPFIPFSTGLWSIYPHFQMDLMSRKRGNFPEFRRILENYTNFMISYCVKPPLFHTLFHNLWKSRGNSTGGCGERVENPLEKVKFSTTG